MKGPRNALEIGQQRYYRCPAHPGDKYVSVTTSLKRTNEWGLPAGYAAKMTAERAWNELGEFADRANAAQIVRAKRISQAKAAGDSTAINRWRRASDDDVLGGALAWPELEPEYGKAYLKHAHVEKRDRAADDGTLCHLAAERIISGTDWSEPDGDYALPERLFPVARKMEDWFRARRYETVLVERTVYHHLLQYAGTLDGLVRDRETGQNYILDLKTQAYRDPAKWRLQLGAYANADHWVDDEDALHPMPEIAGAIVVWIPQAKPDDWLPIKLDVGMETRAAFLSVLHTYRFLTGTKEDDGELDTAWAMGGVA